MFSGHYSIDDLEILEYCEESSHEAYNIPEEVINADLSGGVNSDSLSMGYKGDKAVVVKPGEANFGRSGPGHVAAAFTAERLGLNCPETWYDKENDVVLVEYMGDLDTVFESGITESKKQSCRKLWPETPTSSRT